MNYNKTYSNLFLFLLVLISLFSFSSSAQHVTQNQKITASDRFQNEQFGYSTGISENYMISGAVNEGTLSSKGASSEGAAYIYKKTPNKEWIEIQKIVAMDRQEDDHYGRAVAISDNYAAVGASGQDFDSNGLNELAFSGAVYVYKRNINGEWLQHQKLVASDRERNASFGNSLYLSDKYLIVGAFNESSDPNFSQSIPSSGAVYIFEKDTNGEWYETQKIIASEREPRAYFGQSVSLSGNRIAIGAYWDTKDSNFENSIKTAGAVYIFDKSQDGLWVETQKIVPTDRAMYDFFGFSVALDGDNLLVGAYRKWKNGDGIVGAAYIYKLEDTGVWIEIQKLEASDAGKLDAFGRTVALKGKIAIIGAPGDYDDSNGKKPLLEAGSVYIFKTDDCETWHQVQKFTANIRGYSAGFGSNLSLLGNYLMVGATDEGKDANNTNEQHDAGAAYLFELINIDLTPCNSEDTLTPPPTEYIEESKSIDASVIISIDNCNVLLTASEQNSTYKWVSCDSNNEIITNHTNRSFSPLKDGSYAVIISKNDTTIISDCINVEVTTQVSDSNSRSTNFIVTPNRNSGIFEIIIEGIVDREFPVEIINSFGLPIKHLTLTEPSTQVDLGRINKGIYFVIIKTTEGKKRIPIYIE